MVAPGNRRAGLLAATRAPEHSLVDFLDRQVFVDAGWRPSNPDLADVAGFDTFIRRYIAALPVERAAVEPTGASQRR